MIYLDYAAATPMRKEVLQTMQPYFSNIFANPSSEHEAGRIAKDALENARENIKNILNASHNDEIIFTSGGTESVNLALQGVARAKKKGHIIISNIEHKCVLQTCDYLKTQGFRITKVAVNKKGLVDPKDIAKAIRKDTILISIMLANNEIGTIQPIRQISHIARKHNVLLHTDACQASCYLDLNVQTLGVDLLTLNAAKCYGPKGVGLLYVRRGVMLEPLLLGGTQENGFRAGTQNVAGIIGFSKAVELVQKEKEKESTRVTSLRDWFINECVNISGVKLNGHKTKRLPNNINLTFEGVEAQTLVKHCSSEGILVSQGSACNVGVIKQSYVLQAIGSKEGVRITLGKSTTKKELQQVLKKMKVVISALRAICS